VVAPELGVYVFAGHGMQVLIETKEVEA